MRKDAFREAAVFFVENRIFGAYDPESAEILLVVEASAIEDARACVDTVSPLLGVGLGCELVIEELDELPTGVPTFLKAFFEEEKMLTSRGNSVPQSGTLQ